MFNISAKFWHRKRRRVERTLVKTYRTLSTASVDDLWQKISNLADVSWHPLLARTNVPQGLVAQPGLIYEATTRFGPLPIRIFVERVDPCALLSVRILALPGIEERVTYEIKSTVCGTRVTYSVTLQGWLSPVVWSLIKPYVARVAAELAESAEASAGPVLGRKLKSIAPNCWDF